MAITKITESIKKSEEYKSILKIDVDIKEDYLDCFVRKLVYDKIEQIKISEHDANKIIITFIDDLNGEPLKCGAQIKLEGILVLSEKINFKIGDTNINLRQTKVVDLEKDIPLYDFVIQQPYPPTPSAILTIEFFGRLPREIQNKVEQAISILRLFRVGSIKYITYHMYSESIIHSGFGTVTSWDIPSASEKYVIKDEDVQKLKNFWETMTKYTPRSFYDVTDTNINHINIAYKRYCEALMEGGVIERRMASTVMGFESLFLKREENQELTFRLKIRISKLLSKFGFNPLQIKRIISDAYSIRSLYVHGGTLAYEDRIDLGNKYGNINEFLKLILDYLRISILIMIFVKKGKIEFLDFIDNSLVDEDRNIQFENILRDAKNLVPIN